MGAQRPPKVKDLTKPDRFEIVEGDGRELTDIQTAKVAEQFLEKYRDQPFFLAVGFIATHSPFIAPRRFFECYDAASMPLPVDFATRPTTPIGFPVASVPLRNIDVFANRDATPEAAREMIRAYLATASLVDAQAGRVLNKLDQLGLADNTIVVFFGDHGYHLGEKGKWSKHNSLFEVGARVPLIIRWPQAAGNGTASTRTVQLLDIFPTLAEAARLAPPDGLEGHSLTALLQEPSAPWNHPAMTMAASPGLIGKSIRTERWRYVEWNDGAAGRLLFDHTQDPCELVNLAEEPVLEEIVNDLSKALRR